MSTKEQELLTDISTRLELVEQKQTKILSLLEAENESSKSHHTKVKKCNHKEKKGSAFCLYVINGRRYRKCSQCSQYIIVG